MKRSLALLSLALFVSFSAEAQNARKGKDLRMPDRVKVGETAPDWKLKTFDGANDVQLSTFRGKRPVVLVFGSYT